MRLTALAAVLAGFSLSAMAQNTPVGLWKTISDKDGSVTSEVRVVDNAGVLSGRIERTFRTDVKADAKCDLCKDDRKDQPIIGLEIIRGLGKAPGQEVWEGGTVVDPDNGTVYKLKMTPIDGGKKLEVRGFV
ncbi:MAG: hypothetical protein CFE44_21595, partial [Burkholderiales bacterium PBB4]